MVKNVYGAGLACIFAAVLLIQAALAGEAAAARKTPPVKRADNQMIEEIRKKGTLVVAQVAVNQPPFFWLEKKGDEEKWGGYELDFAADIAKKLGVRLEILRLGEDYNEVCHAVADGRADIGISNISDTKARRELVDFTQPYIVSRVAMLVDIEGLERDNIEAIEPKDLNDPRVKVARTPDSGYEFVIDEIMSKATRVEAPQGDFQAVATPVLEGKAHVVLEDGLTLHLGMTQNPEYASRLHLHVFDEYDDPLSICLPHNQEPLREFINKIIQEMEEVEPVTLEFLVDRYMK